MAKRCVGVLGATSLVGECLLTQFVQAGWNVVAFSRMKQHERGCPEEEGQIVYRTLTIDDHLQPGYLLSRNPGIKDWVCLAPIWVLPEYFSMLAVYGAKRVVALSSTSRFTKEGSSDPSEQALARRLVDGEEQFITWAEVNGVEWVILRPTLIYGLGRDRNICEIVHFIRSFRFFPLSGQAQGLRQPVHAWDVSWACLSALDQRGATNHVYNLSGGETLPYREMVGRVFSALEKPVRFLTVPIGIFRLIIAGLRLLPRFHDWSPAMVERTNRDLVFDHGQAMQDFGFAPRPFHLSHEDLPP